MKHKSLLIFLGLLLQIMYVAAQVSPGDLCRAHAQLEGESNCTKCHEIGNKVTREKCLACHTEILTNINAGKGYHASSDVKGKNCTTCHSDHHGRNFEIIRFNKKFFDHDKTGFTLKGEHAKQVCNACHTTQRIASAFMRKRTGTYIGLNSKCISCHTDFHQGKLSGNCTDCHNFDSWKNPKKFDHSKTRFPLLGQHLSVKCLDCHKTEVVNGHTVQNFKHLVFDNCTGCHKDVHNGKLGQNCKECHTEESFHFNKGMKAFNHDKTNFKLIGKHKLVDCKACHTSSFMTPLKHNHCYECHEDYHKGEFRTLDAKQPDCSECHANNGFTPSTFTIEKHNKGKFKLDNAHLAISCTDCHKKEDKHWTFRNIGERCVDCHVNVHKGFIEEKFIGNNDCRICHDTKNWAVVKFDHDKTGYRLEGAHSQTACSDCHYRKNNNGIRVQQFKGLDKNCSSCHKDSHAGQFENNGITDCIRCHGFDKWENSRFDHNTSRFKLNGAHSKVECKECHKEVFNEKGKYIAYKFSDISCASCHKK